MNRPDGATTAKWKAGTAAVLGWLILGGLGCGALDRGPAAGDGATGSGEYGPSTPWIGEDEESEASEEESEAPKTPVAATPCAPRPASAANIDEVPELPEEVRRAHCPLRQTDSRRGVFEQPYRKLSWSRTEAGYRKVVHGRDGEVDREVHFELDGERVRRVEERDERLFYGNGVGETTWSFDEQGRLTRYESKKWDHRGQENLTAVYRVDQRFDQGRLAERTVLTKGLGETAASRSITWDYDEQGRLTGARLRSEDGTTARSEWSWERGRPTAVKRFVDGIPVFAQSWSYREDGQLASRSVAYGRRGLDGQVAENLPAPPALDDLAAGFPRRPNNIYGVFRNVEGWRALPREDEARGCYDLPTSVGHGYPTQRRAYRAVWKDYGSGKRGYGRLYGIRGFGADNPDEVWFGHGGVLGGRPAGDGVSEHGDVVHTSIRYDARGRMISEVVRREAAEGDGPADALLRRSRDFSREGLTRDRLVVQTSKAGEEGREGDSTVHRRTLRFERDARGDIERRELRFDGVTVAAQDFLYDEQGRWVGIEAFGRGEWGGNRGQLGTLRNALDLSDIPELGSTAELRRRVDDQGRVTLRSWQIDSDRSTRSYRERTDWGPHGPVEVITDHPDYPKVVPNRRRFQYDEQGRKVKMSIDNGSDGEVEVVEHWKWTEDGRLAAKIHQNRRSGREKITRYRYGCARK